MPALEVKLPLPAGSTGGGGRVGFAQLARGADVSSWELGLGLYVAVFLEEEKLRGSSKDSSRLGYRRPPPPPPRDSIIVEGPNISCGRRHFTSQALLHDVTNTSSA